MIHFDWELISIGPFLRYRFHLAALLPSESPTASELKIQSLLLHIFFILNIHYSLFPPVIPLELKTFKTGVRILQSRSKFNYLLLSLGLATFDVDNHLVVV